jgi:L-threonylcarbamoyladenylate synthase
MAETGRDIALAKTLLQRGELVAVPTETVYGLAGNALNIPAISKIFEVKDRPSFDPLIVHIPELSHLVRYVEDVPEAAQILAKHLWPGPLTLLLKKKNIIPDLVTSGLQTVAIRCPNHPLTHDLLASLDFPLAAPSANPFGYVSPTTAAHVNEQLGSKIKYILDGGPSTVGLESTIVGFSEVRPIIHRLGGLSIENLEEIVGPVDVALHSSSNPSAPGQLVNHYAPRKKVFTVDLKKAMGMVDLDRVAILSFQNDYQAAHQFILSPTANIHEAARNFFGALRQLDKAPVDIILAEFVPDEGIGRAINDRLRRAAAK